MSSALAKGMKREDGAGAMSHPFLGIFGRLRFGDFVQIHVLRYLTAVYAVQDCLDMESENLEIVIRRKGRGIVSPGELHADELAEVMDWLNSIQPGEL